MAIFQKRGEWWVGYRGQDGKRHREPVGVGSSYSLAKEVLAKRLLEVAERRHFPGRVANQQTFNDIAGKWWELHGKTRRSDYSWVLNKLRASFGSKKIGAISAADVQKVFNEIASRRAVATANKYLTICKSVFNKAIEWGDFHGANPCAVVKKGQEAAHRLRYLSQDEMKRLLEVANPRLYPVLLCALMTGMRRAEVLGLNWENVSLEHSTIYVLKSKSGKPREVHIVGRLREALVGLGPKESGPVFELPYMSLRRYFERALKDAGIFGFRWHDLRHSFASWFLMRTNDLPALQAILGPRYASNDDEIRPSEQGARCGQYGGF